MSAKHTAITVDWDPETDAICATILEAVAAAKAVDPVDIDRPLYDVVDPDALDGLFGTAGRRTGRDVRLTFRYEGCAVTVEGEGTVTARVVSAAADDACTSALEAGSSP